MPPSPYLASNFLTDATLVLAQSGETLAPRTPVLIVAVLALAVITLHVLSLVNADTHPSRKRIRIASGILMMCGVVSLAYAVGVATPDRPREFTLSWTMVLSLMAIIVGVACIDALNSIRLHASERRALRRELDHARLEVIGVTASRLAPEPASNPAPPTPPQTPGPPDANTPA